MCRRAKRSPAARRSPRAAAGRRSASRSRPRAAISHPVCIVAGNCSARRYRSSAASAASHSARSASVSSSAARAAAACRPGRRGPVSAATIAGICGDYPPTDPQGFDAFAAGLPSADIAAAIAGGEPLDDPVPFRFPASVRHRCERLAGFPAGLLVIGDAVCSFNPIYGQGMTVAATEAMTLRGLLGRRAVPDARRYFRAIAAAIDVAWDIAVGADLAFPQVPGKRSAKVRLVNAYLPRLHAAAAHDKTLAAALIRVIGLKDRPEGLLRPDRVLRVLHGNLANHKRPDPARGSQASAATPVERPMQPAP